MNGRKKSITKIEKDENTLKIEEIPKPVFKIDSIYNVMREIITTSLGKRLDLRRFHPVKSLKLCQKISNDVRDRVKQFDYNNYRIISLCSIIQLCTQSVCYKMNFYIDSNMDNFVRYCYQNSNISIVAVVFLVLKDQ